MTLHPTAAAQTLMDEQQDIDSHTLISLLMDGGLERIEQAKMSIAEGDEQTLASLLTKIVAIIDGLRSNLNTDDGGDIAHNLDALYHYMISRMSKAQTGEKLSAINEVGELLQELKSGWDGIQTP